MNTKVETENGMERRPEVRVHIDQKPYHSPNPTTGAALYALGGVQPGFELYREVQGKHEDTPIEIGPERVHLTQDDHFHSGPPKEFKIMVNGKKKTVTMKRLSFDELVDLAFNPRPTGPNIMFTITYGDGPKANPEGEMLPGQTVKIKDGMVFSVTPTDKS
jgi:hypothetical protein